MSQTSRLRASAAVAALVSATLLIAGCAAEEPSAPPLDLSEKVSPIWEVENDSITGSPVVVDDSVLVYELRGDSVDPVVTLVSYSTEDGSEQWTRESTTGSIKTSSRMYPVTVEPADGEDGDVLVGMLTPPVLNEETNSFEHTAVLLDLATGETVAESPRFWAGNTWGCQDGMCVSRWNAELKAWEDTKLSADGEFTSGDDLDRRFFDGLVSRKFADDLHLTVTAEGAPVEYIVTDGDDILNRVPIEKITKDFEGDALYSLGGAWLDEDENIIIANSNHTDARDSSDVFYGAEDHVTFAFDLKTGELLWKQDGYITCGAGIYCAGGEVGFQQEKNSSSFEFNGGKTTLVRLDSRTGEEMWTYDVAELGGLGNSTQDAQMISPKGYMIFTDGGVSTVIREHTGEIEPMKKKDLVACSQRKSYLIPDVRGVSTSYDGAFVTVACGPGGEVDDVDEFTAGVAAGGTQRWLSKEDKSASDGFYVVQTEGKLLAYQL